MNENPSSTPTLSQPTIRDVVDLARQAPSVYNSQPWSWRIDGNALELYGDWKRLLPETDPRGRELVLSCGVALHQAQVAAHGLGWQTEVARLPEGSDSALLARIKLSPAQPTSSDLQMLDTLHQRRTDRRQFSSWLVPDERLAKLAATAEGWGAIATPVTDANLRRQVETLLDDAAAVQAGDPSVLREQSNWVDRGGLDGIPSTVIPDQVAVPGGRFAPGALEDHDLEDEKSDGLVVLSTLHDDRRSWLQAGEALDDLWLEATRSGLAVLPLTQVVEVQRTREALRRDVLVSSAVPQVLVRIGWPSTTRSTLPSVAHRTLSDVLTQTP